MKKDTTKLLSKVIRIDESDIQGRLDKMVRGNVEETLNGLLEAEADEMCKTQQYEALSRSGRYPGQQLYP